MALIIAEAATQHNGRAGTARAIALKAKKCGADAVKFQIFFPTSEPLFCPMEGDDKRWPRWTRSALAPRQWKHVKEYCDEIGIMFLASAFQRSAVEMLVELDVPYYKVASRAASTYPYELAPGPFLVSLGMDHGEFPMKAADVHFMQCKSQYPHEPLKWRGGVEGFSDHSGSPWGAIHALANGCEFIEVHVSFLTREDDPDKTSSITPSQLRMLCDARDAFARLR